MATINMNSTLLLMATHTELKPVEIGYFGPGMQPGHRSVSRGCGLYCHRSEDRIGMPGG